jgi:hypothetical protein
MRHQEIAGLGSDLGREASRAFPYQEFMRKPLENLTRHTHRVQEAFERADSPRSEGCAIHNRGIEFNLAEKIGPAATADRADSLIGLYQADSGLNRIEAGNILREKLRRRRNSRSTFVIRNNDHECRVCYVPGQLSYYAIWDL